MFETINTKQDKPPMPTDGKIFELTLNADEIEPEALPYIHKHKGVWRFRGERLSGNITRRFKWVYISDVAFWPHGGTLNSIQRLCKRHGRVPEGIWLEAIMETFRFDRSRWAIHCVADSSWDCISSGLVKAYFPCLYPDGGLVFQQLSEFNLGHVGGKRWLVEVN